MFKHQLGLEAQDKITGFKGIITARVDYLTGCNRYCLQPKISKDGSFKEGQYFDEELIKITGKGISSTSVKGKDPGACAPDPIK